MRSKFYYSKSRTAPSVFIRGREVTAIFPTPGIFVENGTTMDEYSHAKLDRRAAAKLLHGMRNSACGVELVK